MLIRRSAALLAALTTIVALAAPAAAGGQPGDLGYDVSNADCARLPTSTAFGIVAVTGDPASGGGQPFNGNPCLAAEATWATGRTGTPALYVNTANPGPASAHWGATPIVPCATTTSASDLGCAYDYGWNAGSDALSRASAVTAFDPTKVTWWLDVETANSWVGSTTANAADLQGEVDRLRVAGVPSVGLYAARSHWTEITGGFTTANAASYRATWAGAFRPAFPMELGPTWVPGAATVSDATTACGTTSFTGVAPLLAQYTSGQLLADRQCAAESTDTTPPVARMTNPISTVALSTLNAGWSSDGSGVSSYDVRYHRAPYNTAFGSYGTLVYASTLHSAGVAAVGGSTYCFSVRARDARANLGPWSAERCTTAPLDDRSLRASAAWSRVSAAGHYRGTYSQTTSSGATLTVGVQSKRLALVATTCSRCGTVAVYVGGSLLKTVSLVSAATQVNHVLVLPAFSFRSATVTLKVVSSGKTVQVDGLVTSRV